jgi:hypothetical protein
LNHRFASRPKQSGLSLLAGTEKRAGKKPKKNVFSNKTNKKELENGLAKLVLVLVNVLIDLLERQAERRVIEGSLTPYETEALGSAFIKIRQTFRDVIRKFGFSDKDLESLLEPMQAKGNTVKSDNEHIFSTSVLVDLLDRLINKQTVVAGQVVISVANIELIILNLLGALKPPDMNYVNYLKHNKNDKDEIHRSTSRLEDNYK